MASSGVAGSMMARLVSYDVHFIACVSFIRIDNSSSINLNLLSEFLIFENKFVILKQFVRGKRFCDSRHHVVRFQKTRNKVILDFFQA